MKRPKLIVIVGLSGSGKTIYAEKLQDEIGGFILSIDEYKLNQYGSLDYEESAKEKEKLSNIIRKDTISTLREGYNVILDAGNITSRKRRSLLREVSKIDCDKECVIVYRPIEKCLISNVKRNKIVTIKEVDTMRKDWQTPCEWEGWDKISLFREDGDERNLSSYLGDMINVDQCNSHHMLTLDRHCIKTALLAQSIHEADRELFYASLLHDYGKLFTGSYEEYSGNTSVDMHYYNHENVGGYELLGLNLYINESEVLELNNVIHISQLICYHMMPYSWKNSTGFIISGLKKFKKMVDDQFLRKILVMHECDKSAH